MNVLINISDEIYRHAKDGSEDSNDEWNAMRAIANGTPIPDNATNGQVIRTLFKPNRVERTDDDVIVENYDFNEEWWNAPYQKGGK